MKIKGIKKPKHTKEKVAERPAVAVQSRWRAGNQTEAKQPRLFGFRMKMHR